jgi:hypothetical protein
LDLQLSINLMKFQLTHSTYSVLAFLLYNIIPSVFDELKIIIPEEVNNIIE